jgi:hypothetical protein
MSLEASMAELFGRLGEWSRLPKYSVERRIDIFLTPFLEGLLRHRLRMEDVRLVAPEFPVLADLLTKGADADARLLSARTVNADYLFCCKWDGPRWLLLELKTDGESFKDQQARIYTVARKRGMRRLLEDLQVVQEKTELRHRRKYRRLRAMLRSRGEIPKEIHVVYLAPKKAKERVTTVIGDGSVRWPGFISLEEFADLPDSAIPPEHAELWPYVRELLRRLESPARRRPSSS